MAGHHSRGGEDISSVCNRADRRCVFVFRSALHIACFPVRGGGWEKW